MDWKLDPYIPDTDTRFDHPIYRDGNCRIVVHQYQSSNWLAFKTSITNKIEISRIYGRGNAVQLMLYFVSCRHNTSNNSFDYPLNDQFLADFAQLIDAYKVGGGPLYVQVFPEFEEWYRSKPAAEQNQYREKIRGQFAAMADIARSLYNQTYIGLCFEGGDFTGDTTQFTNRWDGVLTNSDIVFVNFMSPFDQWNNQARAMIKATRILNHWGLPIAFPYLNLWDDSNTPIFIPGHDYAQNAAQFSAAVTNWIGATLTAPTEIEGASVTNWLTNVGNLKSRGVFSMHLYKAAWCAKPVTQQDPDGFTHPLPSYSALTNVMRQNSRDFLYPIFEAEFWPPEFPPAASAPFIVQFDTNCSSGSLIVLNAPNAIGQHFTARLPVSHNGSYKILVAVRKQADGGWFQLYLDDNPSPQGPERDASIPTGPAACAEFDQDTITFTNINGIAWTDFKFAVSRPGANGGCKLAIDSIKLIPLSPPQIPQPPSGLEANGGLGGQTVLRWNASAHATRYIVKRSNTSGGPYAPVATNVAQLCYYDPNLSNGTQYHYTVAAANDLGVSPDSLEQASATPCVVIVDNTDAHHVAINGTDTTGTWIASSSSTGFLGGDYLHDDNSGGIGGKSVRFTPQLPVSGTYRIYLRWTANANRANNVPVDLTYAGGSSTFIINQRANGGWWVPLTTRQFNAGSNGSVLIRNDNANGYVIADAIKFEFATQTGWPAIPNYVNCSFLNNGVFQIQFAGSSNALYQAWSSTNLIDWTALGDAIQVAPGLFQFNDPTASSGQRFYRVGTP